MYPFFKLLFCCVSCELACVFCQANAFQPDRRLDHEDRLTTAIMIMKCMSPLLPSSRGLIKLTLRSTGSIPYYLPTITRLPDGVHLHTYMLIFNMDLESLVYFIFSFGRKKQWSTRFSLKDLPTYLRLCFYNRNGTTEEKKEKKESQTSPVMTPVS